MNTLAKFNIGAVVLHKTHGYRARIVDIDAFFQASGRPNPQAFKREFAMRNPWYRLAVENSTVVTYVEEPYLELLNPGAQAKPLFFLSEAMKKNSH